MKPPYHDTGTLDKLKQMASAPDVDDVDLAHEGNGEVSVVEFRELESRVGWLEKQLSVLIRERDPGA